MNKKYSNPFGEIFEISRFRLYAGKFALADSGRIPKNPAKSAYHLIDFSDSASTVLEIPVPESSFNEIHFQLGLDSADQSRGAQTGALDPTKGMFWTWNSGYLSFKMEGVSPASGEPAHLFAYHIGGYRYPFSTVRNIRLRTGKSIRLSDENKTVLEIPIELDSFFNGSKPLHIKETANCTTPGELARKISENFAGSFSVPILIPTP